MRLRRTGFSNSEVLIMKLPARPVFPWIGGKTALLPRIRPMVAAAPHTRHVEAFAGGLALFLDRRPERALLGDLDPALIATYSAIRNTPDDVLEVLRCYPVTKDEFYRLRALDPLGLSAAAAAARFVFLQSCGFNGLKRENAQGRSNVAWGERRWRLNERRFRLASEALQSAELVCGDFAVTLEGVGENDLVFLDPPYATGFADYVATGFDFANQERLAKLAHQLSTRGAKILATNHDTPEIRTLWAGFQIHELPIRRNVASSGGARTVVTELAMTNFDIATNTPKTRSFSAPTPNVAANNQQQPKRGRGAGRLTTEAATERTQYAAELIRSGVGRGKALTAFAERYGCSARTTDSYLRAAREGFAAEAVAASGPNVAEARAAERAAFIAVVEADIVEAKASGSWTAVTALRKLLADVRGLRLVPTPEAPAPPAAGVVNNTLNVVLNRSAEDEAHELRLLKRVIALREGVAQPDPDLDALEAEGESLDSDRSAG